MEYYFKKKYLFALRYSEKCGLCVMEFCFDVVESAVPNFVSRLRCLKQAAPVLFFCFKRREVRHFPCSFYRIFVIQRKKTRFFSPDFITKFLAISVLKLYKIMTRFHIELSSPCGFPSI